MNQVEEISTNYSFVDSFILQQEKNCSICKTSIQENSSKKINCQDHYSHIKCIESFQINSRKINCPSCLHYLELYANFENPRASRKSQKNGKRESNPLIIDDPLNENIFVRSK